MSNEHEWRDRSFNASEALWSNMLGRTGVRTEWSETGPDTCDECGGGLSGKLEGTPFVLPFGKPGTRLDLWLACAACRWVGRSPESYYHST